MLKDIPSVMLVFLTILTVFSLACGDDDSSSSSSSSSYTCCVNGAFHTCGSAEDINECTTRCSRDSSRDDECN